MKELEHRDTKVGVVGARRDAAHPAGMCTCACDEQCNLLFHQLWGRQAVAGTCPDCALPGMWG